MSHGDHVATIPENFEVYGVSENAPFAIVGNEKKHFYGVQFHPEVIHTINGKVLIKNFLKLSNFSFNWSMQYYLQQSIEEIKKKIGNKKVICALSGGVDSSVTAILINKAIGNQLTCIYVNNGLMRKNESEEVLDLYRQHFKLNLIEANEKNLFLSKLKGIKDPEKKRKEKKEKKNIRRFPNLPLAQAPAVAAPIRTVSLSRGVAMYLPDLFFFKKN